MYLKSESYYYSTKVITLLMSGTKGHDLKRFSLYGKPVETQYHTIRPLLTLKSYSGTFIAKQLLLMSSLSTTEIHPWNINHQSGMNTTNKLYKSMYYRSIKNIYSIIRVVDTTLVVHKHI